MSQSFLGACACPFGTSVFGFGQVAQTDSVSIKLFRRADGTQGQVRRIDPTSGEFEMDENGLPIGDTATNQAVYLALFTEKGSSAQTDLGIDFKPTVINETTTTRIRQSIERALAALIDARAIRLVSVDVRRLNTSGVSTTVRWKDISTGEDSTLVIQ